MNKSELIEFENNIAKLFNNAKIKAPIHLYSNNENNLIKIFKKIKKNDWFFVPGDLTINVYLKECHQKLLKRRF